MGWLRHDSDACTAAGPFRHRIGRPTNEGDVRHMDEALQRRIATLETELAELKASVRRTSTEALTGTRRDLLKKVAIGSAGVVGGTLLVTNTAGAVDGDNLVIGDQAQTAQTQTALLYTGTSGNAAPGIFKVVDNSIDVPTSAF